MPVRDSNQVRNVIRAFELGYRVGDDGTLYSKTGVELTSVQLTTGGYRRLSFRDDDYGRQVKKALVAQLAAYQWFGEEALYQGVEVRHLDGNPLNNSRANIAIGSRQDNELDKPPELRQRCAKTAARVLRRLTDEEIATFWELRRNGMSLKQLMAHFGLAKGTVSYILNGKTYPELRPEWAKSWSYGSRDLTDNHEDVIQEHAIL